jgi:hypothetical protein
MYVWQYDGNLHGPFDSRDSALEDAVLYAEKEWGYEGDELHSIREDPSYAAIYIEKLSPPINPPPISLAASIKYQWNSAGLIEVAKKDGTDGGSWGEGARNSIPNTFGPFSSYEEARKDRENWAEGGGFSVPDDDYFDRYSPIEEVSGSSRTPKIRYQVDTSRLVAALAGRGFGVETKTFDSEEAAEEWRVNWLVQNPVISANSASDLNKSYKNKWLPIVAVEADPVDEVPTSLEDFIKQIEGRKT